MKPFQAKPLRAAALLLAILLASTLTGLPWKTQAQTQGTLTLSSTVFSGFSVIQITVSDPDISDTTAPIAPPNVTANGVSVKMYQATDGTWFGYIRVWCWADTVAANGAYDPGEPIIIDKNNNGQYDDGELVSGVAPAPGTALVGITPANPPVQDPPEAGTGETTWTGAFTDITTVDVNLGQQITIIYHDNNPAVQVSDVAVFDYTQATISTDRDEYPPGAKAYITIEDQDLNQDPTQAESYTVDPINGQVLLHVDRTRAGTTTQDVYSNIQLVETGPNTGVFELSLIHI